MSDKKMEWLMPKIPNLKGEENLEEWDRLIKSHLRLHKCLDFVKTGSKIPTIVADENEADFQERLELWEDRRTRTFIVIETSASAVMTIIKNNGYDVDNEDPKILYDAIHRTLSKTSSESITTLIRELINVNTDKFESLQKYLDRVLFIDDKLTRSNIVMPKELISTVLLKGMEKSYARETSHLSMALDLNQINYQTLKERLQTIAREEKSMSLANVRAPQPANNNNNGGNTGRGGKPKVQQIQCTQCNRQHPYGRPFHAPCGRCHHGGDDECFVLHPEKRPPSRRGASTPQELPATTPAPAPQQANPAALGFNSGLGRHAGNTDTRGVVGATIQKEVLAAAHSGLLTRDSIVGDSGASAHTFNDLKWFSTIIQMAKPYQAEGAGGTIESTKAGIVELDFFRRDGTTSRGTIEAVYAPEMPVNLISSGELRLDGIIYDGFNDVMAVKSTGQEVAALSWIQNVPIYRVKDTGTDILGPAVETPVRLLACPKISYKTMHQRMMHASAPPILKACHDAGIEISRQEAMKHHCPACFQAKSTKNISHEHLAPAVRPFAEITMDTIEHKPLSQKGHRWSVHILDRCSNYNWIFFAKTKDEIHDRVIEFLDFMENQTGLRVQVVHIDNGTEFNLTKLEEEAAKRRFLLRTIVPGASEQNGPIERAGQTIMKAARATLIDRGLPESDWPYAEEAAVRIINYLPSSANPDDESPHKRFARLTNMPAEYHEAPIKTIRAFGCRAYVHIGNTKVRPRARKMMPTARMGRLYGYEGTHGRVYLVRMDQTGRIIRARDVRFDEGDLHAGDSPEAEDIYEATFDDVDEEEDMVRMPPRTAGSIPDPSQDVESTDARSEDVESTQTNIDPQNVEAIQKNAAESPMLTPPETPQDPDLNLDKFFDALDESEQRSLNAEGTVPPVEERVNPVIEEHVAPPVEGRSRRPRPPPGAYAIRTKKDFFKNNNGVLVETDIYVDEEPVVHPDLVTSLTLTAIQPSSTRKAPYLPKSYQEAKKHPDFMEQWFPALKTQYDTLMDKGTWELVDLPPGAKVLFGKWVLDQKFTSDGEWLRNRARWVVCGNGEEPDSTADLYAAVIHLTTLRVILAIVAINDLECETFDMIAAFLNAIVPEGTEVFVEQPKGFKDGTRRVCRLRKALYGLRKSPRWWFDTLAPKLRALGFLPFNCDVCAFVDSERGIYLVIYVDDFLIAAPTTVLIAEVRNALARLFELKDLGPVKTFLGTRITRDRPNRKVYLDQSEYVKKMLERFGYTELSGVKTPWPTNVKLPKTWNPVPGSTEDYVRETASINFLATGTRPDIQYTVNRLAEGNKGPSKEHLMVLKNLWRYIAETGQLALVIGGSTYSLEDMNLHAYGDASFADDLMTRVSTGGHVAFMAGCPVMWKSKKQTIVTLSTTEAEFVNLTPTIKSAQWIAEICQNAGIPQPTPIVIHTDSQNAHLAVMNPMNAARTRHIDVRYKWITQAVKKGDVTVQFVATNLMKADGFTKPLLRTKHAEFVKQLGLTTPPMGL